MTLAPSTTGPRDTSSDQEPASADQTAERGASSLVRNVLFNWGGHALLIISGFILPRLIDNRLGQASLGVWDFGWSVVGYCGFATAGVRSAVTTYTSRFSTAGNWDGFNDIVNSCLAIFVTAATVAFVAMGTVVLYLPSLPPETFGGDVVTAQWTLAILALSAVLQLPLGVFTGVLTGRQRYDLVNMVEGSSHILVVLGIITLLLTGAPLWGLAVVVLCGRLGSDLVMWLTARRVVKELRLKLSHVRWPTIKFAAAFGGKDMLEYSSRVLMHQTNNIVVTFFLGAPALALFARPAALVQHANRFLTKFAAVFEPASSAAYAKNDLGALRELLVKGTRYSLFVSLPIVAGLTILGGTLLEVWMGPHYRNSLLIGVLAIGNLGFLSQRVTYHILLGMGHHGRAARAMFFGALAAVAGSISALAIFKADLVGVATATVIPFTLVNAIYVPIRACHVTKMKLATFLRRSLTGPVASVLPFAAGLLLTRMLAGPHLSWSMAGGVLASGLVLSAIYWRIALPASIKEKLMRRIRRFQRQSDAP